MSSILVLPPQPADQIPLQYHNTSSIYRGYPASRLHGEKKSVGDLGYGGLPTPPLTTDMTNSSISNGNVAYREQYPYLTEQRSASTSGLDTRPSTYSSNGKAPVNGFEGSQHLNGQFYPTASTKQRQEDQIASHLQIPDSVNTSKGSLAEFAAEMTCLFWFETSTTLEYAEGLPQGAIPDRGLDVGAIPSIGFRKWVTTIISTTQVGKNVILLALMFIYRLKRFNPSVSGKMGSEFRLLTIALMLGNKFLDDNTYTNKTWAEVSGISVNEIHIMEVEFLSNMRYELYASEAQWREWKTKLGRFGSFYEKAARFSSSKNTSPVTPVTQTVAPKLPSPPSRNRYPDSNHISLPNPIHNLPHLPRSPVKYLPGPEYPFERKRSLDTSSDLPPAKRMHTSFPTSMTLSPAALTPLSSMTPMSSMTPDYPGSTLSYEPPTRLPQLPMPMLSNPPNRNGAQLAPLALPGPRSMSAVYPVTTGVSRPVTPVGLGPQTLPGLPPPNPVAPSTSSRAPSHAGSAHTSPVNMFGMSTPTRPGLSPSYILMNRSSPYRPVRHVNTLRDPLLSAAVQNSVKPIDYQQMHYQPLSKNANQPRPGPMPCLQPDAWQSHTSTPLNQTYRPF